MKRLLLVALLGLVLSPELAHAQRRGRAKPIKLGLTFGAKAGLASTNITGGKQTGTVAVAFEQKVLPVVGALANFRFTPQLSIQLEALYAPRGCTRQIVFPGGTRQEDKVRLNYVDVPVLLKFNQKIFYVELGGVGSVLTSDKLTNANGKIIGKGLVNTLDIAYALGAGVELEQGAFFGLRYVRSTSTIGQGSNLYSYIDGLENTAIQLTGGYIFGHSGGRGRGRRR